MLVSPERALLFLPVQKNFRVTNIQFGELYALIKTHLSFPGRDMPPHLRFLSAREFSKSLHRISETFDLRVRGQKAFVVNAYAQEFGQTLVIDPLFCSCLVYLPPLLKLDLNKICGESGYIHSCGVTLLSELVYKTRIDHLFVALDTFLEEKTDSKARRFGIYSLEDWPSASEPQPHAVQDGIDQVKIPVNKFFMGDDRLEDVVAKLRAHYKRRLRIATPGRLKEDHAEAVKQKRVDRQKTIFLIADRKINNDPGKRGQAGDDRFLYLL